jgi:diguanylate cyclase (GGDEF)-like protein
MQVLIAEDNPLDLSVLQLTMEKWDYDIVSCDNGDEALRILKGDNPPSIAILDWMMPGKTGPEICKVMREDPAQQYTFILLLTSKDDKGDVVEGMESGADDYIAKPVDMHELQARLRAGRRIIELQEKLLAAQEELRIQATRDFLTGIWNRAALMEHAIREFGRAERESATTTVLMCDIDDFKSINDTHGHQAGDEVLKEVAERIGESLRSYDILGRYGGEEFMLVLPNTDQEGGLVVAQRICDSVSTKSLEIPGERLSCSLSIGMYAEVPSKVYTVEKMIAIADEALYIAKLNGKNRVEIGHPSVSV